MSHLYATSTRRNVRFDRCRKVSASKLLLLRLSAADHRHCHQLLINARVQLQDRQHLLGKHKACTQTSRLAIPFLTSKEGGGWGGGGREKKTPYVLFRLPYLLFRFLCVGPRCVAFLPKKLSSPQERLRMLELPALKLQ